MAIVLTTAASQAAGPVHFTAGPYWLEYYCPRVSPQWQRRRGPPVVGWNAAVSECHMIKPRAGLARILDLAGRELYRV